jgi:hypothetical protein
MICYPQKCTYDKFGGELENLQYATNFNNIDATDVTAEASNVYRTDLAGMTQTAFQCYIKFDLISGDVIEYEPSWDKNKTTAPVLDYTPSGWTIIFPFFYWDLRGNKVITNILAGVSNIETYGYLSTVQRLNPIMVKLCTFTGNGAYAVPTCNADVFVF